MILGQFETYTLDRATFESDEYAHVWDEVIQTLSERKRTRMIVELKDKKGRVITRTLRRTNVRKVAESIQKAHPGHPLSQTVAILEKLLRDGKKAAFIKCTCEEQRC